MVIAFKELAGSPVETFTPNGIQAQRRILCAWEDRLALVAELFGGAPVGSQAAFPGQSGLLPVEVRVEPFESRPDHQGEFDAIASQLNSYRGQFAEVTVKYALTGASAVALVEEPQSWSAVPLEAEPVTTADGMYLTYRIDSGPDDVPAIAGGTSSATAAPRVPILNHYLTWHRVPSPPWDAIRGGLGCVNDAPFLGAAPAALLFDGITADAEFVGFDDLGQARFGWQLTYIFREKAGGSANPAGGWNTSLPSPGAAPQGSGGSGGTPAAPMYRTARFPRLLTLAE